MQKHRTTILMTVLLGLVGLYILQSQQISNGTNFDVVREDPLDGENEIRNVSIKPGGETYFVKFDYRYRGDLTHGGLRVYALQTPNSNPPKAIYGRTVAKRGVNTAEVRLWRDPSNTVAHSTRVVRVEMLDLSGKRVVVSKDLEYPIDWPRLGYAQRPEQDIDKDVDTLYREAVAEIDYGSRDSMQNARVKLDNIVRKNAQFVPVYPELARYYMKTNWGSEGLRQAERALNSALSIDPNHANSHVLIGYVYAHQGRYQEAEDAFTKATSIGTDNLWLWANWGQLHLMQGRVTDSIAMYKKAIAGVRPYNTYDRARKEAYRHLIEVYTESNNIDSADQLHLKRIAEYSKETSFPYRYAKFRQRHFDDADVVLQYARKALDTGCCDEAGVRKVMGAAYYSKWFEASIPDESQAYLTQARLFFPEGPELIYWLVQTEKTAPIIKGLISDGISIDVADNRGLTALAYAINEDDLEAVKRLIDMGGNPNATVGAEKLPLLAVAVLSKSKETVRYLVSSGADVNSQAYGGATPLELAESMGYHEIAEELRKAAGTRI